METPNQLLVKSILRSNKFRTEMTPEQQSNVIKSIAKNGISLKEVRDYYNQVNYELDKPSMKDWPQDCVIEDSSIYGMPADSFEICGEIDEDTKNILDSVTWEPIP